MIISEEKKQAIFTEYRNWEALQYAGKSREERAELDQYYTPPEISISMIEDSGGVNPNGYFDPTCGCGGFLAASVIIGADPKKVWGIELDPRIVEICRDRLEALGVPRENIRWGNALNPDCYDFEHEGEYHFDPNTGENGKVWYTDENGKVLKSKKSFKFGM